MPNSSICMAQPKRHLLFVDDEPRILDAIRRSLRGAGSEWSLSFANSVEEALRLLRSEEIDVVITDITMPGRDGFDLLREVLTCPHLSRIPVLVLTGLADDGLKRRALDAGAFDLIGKPIQREDLIARVRSVLRTKDYEHSLSRLNATLERQVNERTRDVEASRTDLLVCLAMAGECRDSDTGRHLARVASYTRLLAQKAGLPAADVETLFKASPLHDIGKLGVPDSILLKPGPLTPEERSAMQRHCEIGYRILTPPTECVAMFSGDQLGERRPNPLLHAAAEIALCHHERWDAKGYPRALRGDQIPLSARLVAVADVYDALTTRRPYKEPIAHAAAIELLYQEDGKHFDPAAIAVLRSVSDEFDQVRRGCSDSSSEPLARSAGVAGNGAPVPAVDIAFGGLIRRGKRQRHDSSSRSIVA